MHIRSQRLASDVLQYKYIHIHKENKQVLRYEQIIKDFLEYNNVKLLGIEQNDGRILVEVEKEQKIFKVELVDNRLIIKNVYDEIEYQIELR